MLVALDNTNRLYHVIPYHIIPKLKIAVTRPFFKLGVQKFCMVVTLDNTNRLYYVIPFILYYIIPYYTKYSKIQNSNNMDIFELNIVGKLLAANNTNGATKNPSA